MTKLKEDDHTALDKPADSASSPFKWTLWVTSNGRMIYEFWIAEEVAGSRVALMFRALVELPARGTEKYHETFR